MIDLYVDSFLLKTNLFNQTQEDKTMKKIFIALISLLLAGACSEAPEDEFAGYLKSGDLGADKNNEAKMVTVPFKAHFSVWRDLPPGEGEACEEGTFRETMVGHGEMTHLGEMTTYMSFCVNPTNGMYAFTKLGKFIAANGDELYFDVPAGQVLPNMGDNNDFYMLHFDDMLYFIGGTGRFEDATGTATTNAFVHTGSEGIGPEEFRTDFFSEGTLTLKKGK